MHTIESIDGQSMIVVSGSALRHAASEGSVDGRSIAENEAHLETVRTLLKNAEDHGLEVGFFAPGPLPRLHPVVLITQRGSKQRVELEWTRCATGDWEGLGGNASRLGVVLGRWVVQS